MLYSRQQYLNNVISHEDYYNQFIEEGKSLGFDFVDDVKLYYFDQISKSGGDMSKIKLSSWDGFSQCYLQGPLRWDTKKLFEKFGTYPTLSEMVCILKSAGRAVYQQLNCEAV